MMKIRICSDLHLERICNSPDIFDFIDKQLLPHHKDDIDSVLCIAGDLTNSNSYLRIAGHLSNRFKYVVAVAGNHEYYHSHIGEYRNKEFPDNFFFGNTSDTITIEGIKFIATTLWSNIKRTRNENIISASLNDFNCINGLNIESYMNYYCYQMNWIVRELENVGGVQKVVVLTHHCPSLKSVHPKYKDDKINDAFVSDLDWVIERYQPKLWIHGHTHSSFDYMIGNTNIVCNPFGYYAVEENIMYQPRLYKTEVEDCSPSTII